MYDLLSNIIWYAPQIQTVTLLLLAILGLYVLGKVILKGKA